MFRVSHRSVFSIVAAVLTATFAISAAAQTTSNQLGGGAQNGKPTIKQSVGPAFLAAVMAELNFQAADVTSEFLEPGQTGYNGSGTTKVLKVTASPSEIFYIAVHECAAGPSDLACPVVEVFSYFDASGVTLNQVNTYNMSQSFGSVIGLRPDGIGLIVQKFYVAGGVSTQNIRQNFGIFFLDYQKVASTFRPGIIAQVNYTPSSARSAASAPTGSLAKTAKRSLVTVTPVGDLNTVNAIGAAGAALVR